MTAPIPQPGILDIAPYIGGKASAAGSEPAIKLSSNESALGPSPRAIAAFKAVASELHRYPDGGSKALRDAIAVHHGLVPDRIVCGNGSDELISLITSAYCGNGDEVLYSKHGFLMYHLSALACGATPVAAPETEFTANVDSMLAAVTDKTRLVFLANPNNPTGTYLPSGEIKRLRKELPENVLLVIDAAYAEFVSRNDYTSGAELVDDSENTVMTRTFSKIYGLAGLRIGWAYCPWRVADVLQRVRGPFNVNAAAQAAALAALEDVAFTDAARTHNDVWLPKLAEGIAEAGLETIPSVGNFVLIRFPETPGNTAAEAASFLAGRGILLRGMEAYKLPNCLRATVGTAEENEAVIAGCKAFMSTADQP